MERRTLITKVANGMLGAPLAAGAQQAGRAYRIRVLSTTLGPTSPVGQAFRERPTEPGRTMPSRTKAGQVSLRLTTRASSPT